MWNDTRATPLLPERAPSEGPRSTAAMGPARVPSHEDEIRQAWKEHLRNVVARCAQWGSSHRPFYVREETCSPHASEWSSTIPLPAGKFTPLKDLALLELELGSPNRTRTYAPFKT